MEKNNGRMLQGWSECQGRVKGDCLMRAEGESAGIEFDVHFTLVSLWLLRKVPVCGSLLSCNRLEWRFSAVCARGVERLEPAENWKREND